MHGIECFGYLVQGPADKVLTELTSTLLDDKCERSIFHELENDPNAPIVLIDLVAVNQLLTVQMLH